MKTIRKTTIWALALGLALFQASAVFAFEAIGVENNTGLENRAQADEAPSYKAGFVGDDEDEAARFDPADPAFEPDVADNANAAFAGTGSVYDEEGLRDWLMRHMAKGGTVCLERNVTITSPISVFCDEDNPIIIDVGEYGLFFNGADSDINGENFMIIGQGVKMPVVTMKNVNKIRPGMDNWNTSLSGLTVIATGDEADVGGVAVRVLQDDNSVFGMPALKQGKGFIRSIGTGAVGLKLDAPMDVYCIWAETNGDDSAAVSAPEGSALFYSRLSAFGDGAAAVTADVFLDTCAVSPEPQDAKAFNRKITDTVGHEPYLPALKGEKLPSLPETLLFKLDGSRSFPAKTEYFGIVWDKGDIREIDMDVPGRYTVDGALNTRLAGLGLEDDFSIAMTIEVCDPELPLIDDVAFIDVPGVKPMAIMHIWRHFLPYGKNLRLWRSEDGGDNWGNAIDAPDIEMSGSSIVYYYSDLTSPVKFCIELAGAGFSNIVTLYVDDGGLVGDIGGDRTTLAGWLGDPGEEDELGGLGRDDEDGSGGDGDNPGEDGKDPGKGSDGSGDDNKDPTGGDGPGNAPITPPPQTAAPVYHPAVSAPASGQASQTAVSQQPVEQYGQDQYGQEPEQFESPQEWPEVTPYIDTVDTDAPLPTTLTGYQTEQQAQPKPPSKAGTFFAWFACIAIVLVAILAKSSSRPRRSK